MNVPARMVTFESRAPASYVKPLVQKPVGCCKESWVRNLFTYVFVIVSLSNGPSSVRIASCASVNLGDGRFQSVGRCHNSRTDPFRSLHGSVRRAFRLRRAMSPTIAQNRHTRIVKGSAASWLEKKPVQIANSIT